MLRLSIVCLLAACSSSKTPCANDMPGPGAGCTIEGTWTSGSGDSAMTLTFTTSTFSGTFGSVSDSGAYAITGGLGCDATFAITSNMSFSEGNATCASTYDFSVFDAGAGTGTYGIVVGSKCDTFSLSTQYDVCTARSGYLGGAQFSKQK